MAWKKICEKATRAVFDMPRSQCADIDDGELVGWMARQVGRTGKSLRVTVEEEVSECCEKWIGWLAVSCSRLEQGERGTFIYGVKGCAGAKFCPECGKKL